VQRGATCLLMLRVHNARGWVRVAGVGSVGVAHVCHGLAVVCHGLAVVRLAVKVH